MKLPPQNLEAEQSILGGLMLESEAWDQVCDIISESDFYKPAHKKIFSTIYDLYTKSQRVDILTVSDLLTKKNEIDLIGGSVYLAEILNQTPTAANIKSYAQIVKEKSLLRRLITASTEIAEDAFEGKFDDVNELLDRAENKIFSIVEQRSTQGLIPINDILKDSLARIESLYQQKASITGIPSGYDHLDKITAGFQPGELIIVAARPSMGKTAFALNMAMHAAIKKQKKIAFFSVEMAKEQIMIRLLSISARIDVSQIRVGNISDSDWPKLIHAASRISESPIYIDDTPGISPYEIRAKCRRLKAQHGLDMIVIDYIQMMDLKQKTESRERAVSEMSRALKAIAKELKIPVMTLAQLNRAVEGRSDRRPLLSDLRESGSLEQDADVIMMLYRDDYYEKDHSDHKGVAEVIVNKNRNGPTDIIKLAWLPQYGVFGNLAPESLSYAAPTQKFETKMPDFKANDVNVSEIRKNLSNFAPKN